MICTNCGARLLDTDQFCPKCGDRVTKEKRCPECGEVLRDGTKFCHKCGSLVESRESARKVTQETLDIPIDAIEKNILSETAAEIRADRRAESMPRRTSSGGSTSAHRDVEKSKSAQNASPSNISHGSSGKSVPSKKKAPVNAPPPKKRASYREEEDWDDEDWDDEDEGIDVITVMTAIVGCVLLVVIAVLGYHMYLQYMPKDYGTTAEKEQDEEDELSGQEMETEWFEDEISEQDVFTITVTHNVNVRDNPSTSGTNVLKVAQEGETYTSVGSVEGGEWYEILLEDGSTGYVFHEYVTVE